jgi:hypothetical protein
MASNEHVLLERLRQELDGPAFIARTVSRHVPVTGDEDDRHVRPLAQLLWSSSPTEPRQCHVEHQQHGTVGRRAGQEFIWPTRTFRAATLRS